MRRCGGFRAYGLRLDFVGSFRVTHRLFLTPPAGMATFSESKFMFDIEI